ncbi:MAG: response regulator [Hassallia sp.]
MKILLVEDDEFVAEALVAVLNNQNYVVEIAPDGETAWDLVEIYDYDLILLDVILPKLDGISLCRKIRLRGLQMPIMLLTGCDSSHEKATGLDAGADDYLVKPFDQEELIARVRALLRRGIIPSQPVLEWGSLRLDPTSCEVTYSEQPLSLTPKEYALLELFLRNTHRVFSCGMILQHIWSYDDTPGEEAVRTHIKGLRTKLRSVGAPGNLVETVYGIGYRLKLAKEDKGTGGQGGQGGLLGGEKKDNSSFSPSPSLPLSPSPTPKQTLLAIAGVWNRFKGRVGEQVTLLEKAAVASSENALNQELRKQAFQEAHSLAGSLGTFGFPFGSKLAQKIEHLLKTDKILTKAEKTQFKSWVELLHQEIERNQDETVSPSPPLDEYPMLLVVDRDRLLGSQLAIDANSNLKVAIATNIETAIQKLYQEHPSVVLLDPSVSPLDEDSLRLLSELNDRKPPVPVIVFTELSDFSHRLQVARHGRHTFLQKPLPIAQILQAVTEVLQHAPDAEAHVLAVDDDPKIGALLQVLLTPWGIKVTTLNDPQSFWETLESIKPDFLILDVEMPGINGMEICQVVRNDLRWSELPILFLTVHSDANIINQVFAVGADDFVSKPIIGPELVTRIINRLERIKLRQRLAQTQQAEADAGKNDITRIRQQTTVANLAQSALSGKDFSSLMNEAVTLVAENLQVEYCNISELLPKENTWVLRSGVGWDSKLIGQEIINLNAVINQPVIIEDLQKSESNSFLQQHQVKSGLSVPIFIHNRFYGVLGAYTRKKQTFSLDDVNFVQAIANVLSAAFERQQTEEALRKGKEELELSVAERTAQLIKINQQLQLELNERQRTQEALRNSQSRFAGIVEIADDAIISIDSNQRITLFNQGAEKIFGYTAAEVLGQRLDLLLPLRYTETHRQHVSEFGNSRKVARRMGERREIYGCRKDGSEFPAEASISKLKLGEETVYTVYLQDISDVLRQAAPRLRKQVERMKDEFVSVTSHELRTPLTSIYGSLKMLASDLIKSDSEQGKRLLQIAVNSSERLVRLVNDILDIERIESGKVKMEKQTCNIDDLIAQAVNVIQPLAEAANVSLSVSSLSQKLWVDGDRIVQTLTNLLSNAIKFSHVGATIQVSVELRNGQGGQGDKGARRQGEIGTWETSFPPTPPLPLSPSPHLLIQVKDTGRGIPPDKLESIFERFQQVDSSDSRNYDGTGLGLAICKSIVQQHSGCIWAESVLGEGSNFYLVLPIVQSQDSELLFS